MEQLYPKIPKNWELLEFQSTIHKYSTNQKKVKQKEYLLEGLIPVVDQGDKDIGGYTNDNTKKMNCELPVIVFGDHTKKIKFVKYDFAPGADGVKVIKPLKYYNQKLFYYYLHVLVKKIPDKGYARHFQHVEKTKIPLPPLNEQHRIVSKIEELFSDLDNAVENLKKAKEQLTTYRQAVLKAAFEGKLTEEWRKKNNPESAEKLLKKIKKERERYYQEQLDQWKKEVRKCEENRKKGKKPSKPKQYKIRTNAKELDIRQLHELPVSWVWSRIAAFVRSMKNGIYKPKRFYSDSGIACLRMYNIQNGRISWYDIKRMNLNQEDINDYLLKPGDLLINRVNSRELVGKTALIKSINEKCVYESKNIRLRLAGKVDSAYINYWFLLNARRYFNSNTQQTVGMASINQEQINSMPVPICSYPEQTKIVEEIERRLSICENIESSIQNSLNKTVTLKQSILKKAFEGKLVPQDPDNEPAWKLLERIKADKGKHEETLSG